MRIVCDVKKTGPRVMDKTVKSRLSVCNKTKRVTDKGHFFLYLATGNHTLKNSTL